jgi:hypothetical protein
MTRSAKDREEALQDLAKNILLVEHHFFPEAENTLSCRRCATFCQAHSLLGAQLQPLKHLPLLSAQRDLQTSREPERTAGVLNLSNFRSSLTGQRLVRLPEQKPIAVCIVLFLFYLFLLMFNSVYTYWLMINL